MSDMTSAIIEHYNKYDESKRLKSDIGPLEEARTRELVLRYLPLLPAVVIDVGGANGPYSFWLAGLGYRVYLVDLVPRHIDQAAQLAQQPGIPPLAGMKVGDACSLDFDDQIADVVLLHGPLYHLTAHEERLQAIREAWRVLKPGGVLLAFAITRYAGLIYGLDNGLIFDPTYLRMIRDEVNSGQRENPPPGVFTFPNAYFHLPQELEMELKEGGFIHEATLGILGPAWLVPDLEESWQDPARREAIMEIARLVENEPVLGPRLMGVGRR